MTQHSTPTGKTRFRAYFLKQSAILTLLFILLNSVTLWRAGNGVQAIDVMRMVLASLGVGCIGAVVMWFLPGRKG